MRTASTYGNRKELLALPVRGEWGAKSEYGSLLLVPTGKKHDSGWSVIAIVGVKHNEAASTNRVVPVEIAAYCDDINWYIETAPNTHTPNLRTDCDYPSGIMHMWGNDLAFEVGASLSSTDVRVRWVAR